jgi:hypothetical protein
MHSHVPKEHAPSDSIKLQDLNMESRHKHLGINHTGMMLQSPASDNQFQQEGAVRAQKDLPEPMSFVTISTHEYQEMKSRIERLERAISEMEEQRLKIRTLIS